MGAIDGNLWRYLSFDHFLNILRTRKLLFRKVSEYPDPFEGSIPKSIVELREQAYENSEELPTELPEALSAMNERIRDSVYANCWHANQRESEAMWQDYGNEGVAVITNTESLFSAFENLSEDILLREVEYLNFYDSLGELREEEEQEVRDVARETSSDLVSPTIMKRKSFQHENEVRLLRPEVSLIPERKYEEQEFNLTLGDKSWGYPMFAHIDGEFGAVDLRDVPAGDKREFEVDLEELINEVRINPKADRWFLETVEEAVKHLGPKSVTPDIVEPSNTEIHQMHF